MRLAAPARPAKQGGREAWNVPRDAPAGSSGEIVLRGPQIARANHSAESEESLQNGWLHTGDIGHIDAAGYVFLDDHRDDVVISGGDLIHCAEIETVLRGCDGVQEAAVVGIPDPVYGEIAVAFIVPAPGMILSEADVIRHCRRHIGRYKIPRHIVFADSPLRTVSGAVPKSELLRRYAVHSGQELAADRRGNVLP